ncbi:MAG: T9SS type A sorting domain-containing protein [Chitinophagaceae bacterium]|nr:T9SS type A sorting domain-containing protein [Chitinophagaceae bacterium]MCW5904467.1 T9SS type A sorting domain-containing protein [Chitinophagaceae bacterium]
MYLVCVHSLYAQINYSFTTSITNFNTVTNGTMPFLSGNGTDPLADEGYVNYIPIGFSFQYNGGNTYEEVGISTNGFISFSELSNSYIQNNLTSGALGERPLIAPLWDDLDLSITSNLTYTTTGTAPNRIFTVEWLNVKWGFGASDAAISFQIKLYETKNWIEFIYRPETGNSISPSASIGLTTPNSGNNNFLSIGNISLSPSLSVSSETTNITNKPSSIVSYMFKPGSLPVRLSSFTVKKENEKNIVQWTTVQEINNKQFNVQRSNNGVVFSTIAIQPAYTNSDNANSVRNYTMIDEKPIIGTNYYRLEQVDNDGKISYSPIVSIKNGATNWATLNIYPNPVRDNLHLSITTYANTPILIKVVDVYGRCIIQCSNNITSANNVINMPINHLTAGVYYIQLLNGKTNEYITQRFIKQ